MTPVPALLFEADPATGALYWTLSTAPVARTLHVDDFAMVDLDEHGDPVGLEIPSGEQPTHDQWVILFNAAPLLKEAFPAVL